MEWGTLSSVAVAMSLATLCVRWRFPSVSGAMASAGLGASIALLALSMYPLPLVLSASLIMNAAFMVGGLDHWLLSPAISESEAKGAMLRLTFYGDDRHPTAMTTTNVNTWFAFYTPHMSVGTQAADGSQAPWLSIPRTWAIFIAYERPTEVAQILAFLNAPGLPPYTILMSTKRACVVAFNADIPAGDLEVDVRIKS